MRFYFDTETAGLMGPVIVTQYAIDDGPIHVCAPEEFPFHYLYDPSVTAVAFNARFDLFKMYQVLHAQDQSLRSYERPVKPFTCKTVDLWVWSQLFGPFHKYAACKGRSKSGKPVAAIRRCPKQCVDEVVAAVTPRLAALLPKTAEITTSMHEVEFTAGLQTVEFIVTLRKGLKDHAEWLGEGGKIDIESVFPLSDFDEKEHLPYYDEELYAPLIAACNEAKFNPAFQQYATQDIHLLRLMDRKAGLPEPTPNDDTIACVAYTRYFGFPLDREELWAGQEELMSKVSQCERDLEGVDLDSPKQRLTALQMYDPMIQATNKDALQAVIDCESPAARIAQAMLDYGSMQQELRQIVKMAESETNRGHFDLNTMGAVTGRATGTGGFNAQGVGKDSALRRAILTDAGGDFASFEISIAAQFDENLLKVCRGGLDVHTATMVAAHPEYKGKMGYEEARRKYLAKDPKVCKDRAGMKTVVFGVLYGCSAETAGGALGVTKEEGQRVLDDFFTAYPGLKTLRTNAEKTVCTADTENWSKDSVAKMARSVKDLTGFVRRFDFEADVARVLWELGCDGVNVKATGTIIRTKEKGPQDVPQAVRSALLGSAIAIQQAVSRQAVNAPVQATGANFCKDLQSTLWNYFHVPMLNVHDELVVPRGAGVSTENLQEITNAWISQKRSIVECLDFKFETMEAWGDKR